MRLAEAIGNPTLTVGSVATSPTTKFATAQMAEVLRWSQTSIDLAAGDPVNGNFMVGSPLAVAFAMRGAARWALGDLRWRDDLDRAVAMARKTDPWSYALVIQDHRDRYREVAISLGCEGHIAWAEEMP